MRSTSTARHSSSTPPARLHEVTGDELAKKVASDAFDWLESHAHDSKHGGYFEAIRRDGTPILSLAAKDAPMQKRLDRLGVYYGFKSMNSHIHLLEAIAELKKIDDRPIVKERLLELLSIVRDRIAVEPGALNLYLTPDWRAIPAHDSFGHDVETAFLLVEAAAAARHAGRRRRPGKWPACWSTTHLSGAGTKSPAVSMTRASRLAARRSTARKFGGRRPRA